VGQQIHRQRSGACTGTLVLLKRLGAVVEVDPPKDKDAGLATNVFHHRSYPATYYTLSKCAGSLQKIIDHCKPLETTCPKANVNSMEKHVTLYMKWIDAFMAWSGLGGGAPGPPKASGGGALTPESSSKSRDSGSGSKETGDYAKKHVARKRLIIATLRMNNKLPTDGHSEKASGQSHVLSL
jgi:hypothetical protein